MPPTRSPGSRRRSATRSGSCSSPERHGPRSLRVVSPEGPPWTVLVNVGSTAEKRLAEPAGDLGCCFGEYRCEGLQFPDAPSSARADHRDRRDRFSLEVVDRHSDGTDFGVVLASIECEPTVA